MTTTVSSIWIGVFWAMNAPGIDREDHADLDRIAVAELQQRELVDLGEPDAMADLPDLVVAGLAHDLGARDVDRLGGHPGTNAAIAAS